MSRSLEDSNNFYYCRYETKIFGNLEVQKTQIISTIVDVYLYMEMRGVQKTQIISTIVDNTTFAWGEMRLEDSNNFYYCRS